MLGSLSQIHLYFDFRTMRKLGLMATYVFLFFGLLTCATTATLNRTVRNGVLMPGPYEWSYDRNIYDPLNGLNEYDETNLEANDWETEEYDEDSEIEIQSSKVNLEEYDEEDLLQTVEEDSLTEMNRQKREVGRVKRTVTNWEEAELDMAIGSSHQGAADLGDSYDFTVSLSLPVVSSPSPLNVEIFASDPENGTSSLHICSPTISTLQNVSSDFVFMSVASRM